jgi:hypothetical protein
MGLAFYRIYTGPLDDLIETKVIFRDESIPEKVVALTDNASGWTPLFVPQSQSDSGPRHTIGWLAS